MIASVPVLTGERVVLRPYSAGFSEDELRALYAWGRDKELIELSGGNLLDMPFERFREMFMSQLPRRNTGGEQLYAILDRLGRMIGRIGLFGLTDESLAAELGVVIGDRAYWNRGFGRDAVATLSEFGFRELGLHRVFLYTFIDNTRAQRAFGACGFTPVRQLRRFSFEHGMRAELEMELLAPDA
jgi:RimJ/RimL family protein N-acetyltransferase